MKDATDATDAALACARDALFAGQAGCATALLCTLVTEQPLLYEARYWLASALAADGDAAAAAHMIGDARTLHAALAARDMGADLARCRDDGAHAVEVAQILYTNQLPAMAAEIFGMAISAGHVTQPGLLGYGLSRLHQGRPEEAIMGFQAAAETFPSAEVAQFLLFPHVFVENADRRFSRAARAWAQAHAPAVATPEFDNPPSRGRRLRIGYVAPNFTQSQLRQFIAPLIEAHEPSRTEIFLYPANASTETGWGEHIVVHPIGHLGDDDAAELIRGDRIDVLSDCWGHSAGSRLKVFARRPAPVQVGWINFTQTTGLDQIDHVLHADGSAADPTLYTEDIWSIGPVFTPFRPSLEQLSAGPTPALGTGRMTFGSFNHPAKMSDATVAAWAEILKRTPGSQLLLKYRYFIDPVLQRATCARFAGHGVEPERLRFEGHSSGAEYAAAFGKIDLALDPWPAPGSTTTLEAISHGVPVLALAGAGVTTPSHYPRTILQAAGLGELVCDTPDDYVRRAVELTADFVALDALRARVRPGFDAGPLRDEAGFARRIDDAFRRMFESWREHRKRVLAVA